MIMNMVSSSVLLFFMLATYNCGFNDTNLWITYHCVFVYLAVIYIYIHMLGIITEKN